MTTAKTEWFRTWFDSPYYPLLYKDHDEKESASFLGQLIEKLGVKPGSKVLDICCGNGRHSLFLEQAGFRPTGIDLSPRMIQEAKKRNLRNSEFYLSDIRDPIPGAGFELALNLFSSFGYFETIEEDQKALKNIQKSLTSNGEFVIDYLNIDFIKKCLPHEEEIEKGGKSFQIKKEVRGDFLEKAIRVENETFYEKLRLLDMERMSQYLESAGFEIMEVYGDYHLPQFEKDKSPRLIIRSKKTQE